LSETSNLSELSEPVAAASAAESAAASAGPATAGGGVQSVHRALDLLEIVAAGGGSLAIAEIAGTAGLPVPTVHRLLRTLVERGYMRQLANRRYALGFGAVPLATTAMAAIGAGAGNVLSELVVELGETANLAVLCGDHAQYVAQAPSPHMMRTFTEVGRQVDLHCTGVGKVLLSQLDDTRVEAITGRAGLARRTPRTLVDRTALLAELNTVRTAGHAVDEQEQELGVRCVAVGVSESMAVSVSGPLYRMTDEVVGRAVPLLHQAAHRLLTGITEGARSR
jgi:IclR family acetate operon transcriptional repressor